MTKSDLDGFVFIKRRVMARLLRDAYERLSDRGIPRIGSLAEYLFRSMLEGLFRHAERLGGVPQFSASYLELVEASQQIHEWNKQTGGVWYTESRSTKPWATVDVAKAKFYEWRKAIQNDNWQEVPIVGPDGDIFHVSLKLFSKYKNAYVRGVVEKNGAPVAAIPGPARRPALFTLREVLLQLPFLNEPKVDDVEIFAGAIGANAALFGTPIVFYTHHEYVFDVPALGAWSDWHGIINWGDGDQEPIACGEEIVHTYREPIERTAITIAVLSPQPTSRMVPIEVRRYGLRDMVDFAPS